MKISKTLVFAVVTIMTIASVYFFDYRVEKQADQLQHLLILKNDPEHINNIQIIKPDIKIVLQKNQVGWSLTAPIQDLANSDYIDEFLKSIAKARQISVIKESSIALTESDLREFGLDKPAAVFNFTTNFGEISNISVGTVKNFEGNSYIRIGSENKIIMAEPLWLVKAESNLIQYREVKLYRHDLAQITEIKIKSLRDKFDLKNVNGRWVNNQFNMDLDQNKVREILKKLSTANILDYVSAGQPTSALLKEKGLDKGGIFLEFKTDNLPWSVSMNVSQKDKALYALTTNPCFLVKVDVDAWETFGNLEIDQLRDRTSAFSFKAEEVRKIFYRHDANELNLIFKTGSWSRSESVNSAAPTSSEQVNKSISNLHDLQISKFIDNPRDKEKFRGDNMLVLKSENEKLVLQLNWGPSFKVNKMGQTTEYYYVRSHLSHAVFAIEKSKLDALEFDKVTAARKTEIPNLKQNNGEKVEL